MGPDLVKAALFEKMREASRKDVEKLLEEAPTGKPKAELKTRKQQKADAAATAEQEEVPQTGAMAEEEEEEAVVSIL